MNRYHKNLLEIIKREAGKPEKNPFLENYLGTKHPRYNISTPKLRSLAKNWAKSHEDLSSDQFADVLNSLIHGKSFTEKCFAGILLDYATSEQRLFSPYIFESWLDQLEGWAEVDTLCTGRYSEHEIINQWKTWKPLLNSFSQSKNIHHRRASLVLLCSCIRKSDNATIAKFAFSNIKKLKHEKEVLITKAISWVLRCLIVYHRNDVEQFLKDEKDLPAIAVRETSKVLKTGKKTG